MARAGDIGDDMGRWLVLCPHICNVDGAHEGDVGEAADVVDEPLQHQEPPWPADDVGVHGEVKGATITIEAVEFRLPA